MKKLDRQGFLKLAGAGSAAVAATGTLPAGGALASGAAAGPLTLRAVAQLPAKPLAGYASYVLSGHIDVAGRSGTLAQTVFAGPPEAMSTVGLPGLSRSIRVTDVYEDRGVLHITGIVDDRSQLEQGESPHVAIRVDRTHSKASVRFGETEVALRLESE
jgi:hypothetical protein